MKLTNKKAIFIFFVIISSSFLLTCGKNIRTNLIDYSFTLYNEFKNTANVGRVIPLTISKSAEIDGALTKDAKFLYFASNREGNFDIYVRGMGDIVEKAITQNAADDISPQISPDGKKLIFVSKRDDPYGDIMILKAKPEKWLTSEGAAIDEYGGDKNIGELINITEVRDERNVRQAVTDIDPIWSPDGKKIAFVSNRGKSKMNDVWLMEPNGNNKRQLTFNGGVQPSFSPNGSKIIYISYQDKNKDGQSLGEIYEIPISGGKGKRLTFNDEIEMYPIYLGNEQMIAYTRIQLDTNEDGVLDLKDNSVIQYWNMAQDIRYPLTTSQTNSFNVKFYQKIYKDTDVILYTSVRDGNLDVAIIPITGIIPIRTNIISQYDLADKYLSEFDDQEKYILALRRIKDFHANHPMAYIFLPRAFLDIADFYMERGKNNIALSYLQELKDTSVKNGKTKQDADKGKESQKKASESTYEIIAQSKIKLLRKEDGISYLQGKITEFYNLHKDKIKFEYSLKSQEQDQVKKIKTKPTPEMNQFCFLYETLGELAVSQKNYIKAQEAYDKALSIHDLYPLYQPLLKKAGQARYESDNSYYQRDMLPPEWDLLFKMGRSQRDVRLVETILIAKYANEKSGSSGIQKIAAFKKRYGKYKNVPILVSYIESSYNLSLKRYDAAIKGFQEVVKKSHKTHPIHFSSLYLLGAAYEQLKKEEQMAGVFYDGITKYLRAFRNPAYHQMKVKLVNYYDNAGREAEAKGNYPRAAGFYKKWVALMHELNVNGISQKLYAEKGVEAHTRYIDASLKSFKKDQGKIEAFIKEYNAKQPTELARVTYNKAYLFGAAYLYHKYGLQVDTDLREAKFAGKLTLNPGGSIETFLDNQKKAEDNLKWVIYMDEEFLEAYLLQGFIYTLVDIRRQEDKEGFQELYKDYFRDYLLEYTIDIYNKAIRINNENNNPEMEANFYLNLANSYYLLKNYPKALDNFNHVLKYKSAFDSANQEALFYFHLAYSYWQNGQFDEASRNFSRVKRIYEALSAMEENRGKGLFDERLFRITQYLALVKQEGGKYGEAIDLYQQIIAFAEESKKTKIGMDRIYQELSYCYYKLGDTEKSLAYLEDAAKILKDEKKESRKEYNVRLKVINFRNKIGYKFDVGFLSPFLIPNLMVFNIADSKGFPVWDLGEDSSVIGGNRIFRNLYQEEKLGFNYALYADNYLYRGDYERAIEYLLKKWNSLEKPKTKFDWEIKAVTGNNLGYYYFFTEKYEKGKEYFDKAAKILSSEIKDANGEQVNRINNIMVTFYLLEQKPELVKEPLTLIESTLEYIKNYTANYRKNLTDEYLKAEKERLKVKKQKITPKDEDRVRLQVEKKVKMTFFRLEMIKTDLHYYRVNIMENLLPEALKKREAITQKDVNAKKEKRKDKENITANSASGKNELSPSERFQQYTKTYEQVYDAFKQVENEYADLLSLMQGSAQIIEKVNNKKGKEQTLPVNNDKAKVNKNDKNSNDEKLIGVPSEEFKLPDSIRKNKRIIAALMGNRARVLHKMGRWGEALTYYLRVLRISNEYGYDDITVPISYYTASILEENPDLKELLGRKFIDFDDEFFETTREPYAYYSRAMELLEGDMYLARFYSPFIKKVFEASQRYLVQKKNDPHSALLLAEKEARIQQVMDLVIMQPELNKKDEQKTLFRYFTLWKELAQKKERLTLVKEKIATLGSEVPVLKSAIEKIYRELHQIQEQIHSEMPHLASFCLNDPNLKKIDSSLIDDEVIIRYKIFQEQVYIWIIKKDAIQFHTISFSSEKYFLALKKNDLSVLSSFMKDYIPALDKNIKRIYIVQDSVFNQVPFHYLELPLSGNEKTNPPLAVSYQITYLPDLTAFDSYSDENSISRRTYKALGVKEVGNITSVVKLAPARVWHDIGLRENVDILDVNGNISIREGFKRNFNLALLMLDISQVPELEYVSVVKKWLALANYWKTSAVVLYNSTLDGNKDKLVAAFNNGSSYELSKVIFENKGNKAKASQSLDLFRSKFWYGIQDFARFTAERLTGENQKIEREIETLLLDKKPLSVIPLIERYRHINGDNNAPAEIKLQSFFYELEGFQLAGNLSGFEKKSQEIKESINSLNKGEKPGFFIGDKSSEEYLGMLSLMQLDEIYFSRGMIQGDAYLKEVLQFSSEKKLKNISHMAQAIQGLYLIKSNKIERGRKQLKVALSEIKDKGYLRKMIYRYGNFMLDTYYPEIAMSQYKQGLELTEKNNVYYNFFCLGLARASAANNNIRMAENVLGWLDKESLQKGHEYNLVNIFVKIIKREKNKKVLQELEDHISFLKANDSRFLKMDFELMKSMILVNLRRYREAYALLSQKYFSSRPDLEKWGIGKNIYRFKVLAKCFSSMELLNDFMKNQDMFIEYLKTNGHNAEAFKEYYYYILNAFQRNKLKVAQEKGLAAIEFFGKISLANKTRLSQYHDILFMTFDSALQLKQIESKNKIWQLIKSDNRIEGWRKAKREGDEFLAQREEKKALSLFQGIIDKLPLDVKKNSRFADEIEDSYKKLITLLKQNKKTLESMKMLREYYDWKYSISEEQNELKKKKGKDNSGKAA